jgi:hypothetical protein
MDRPVFKPFFKLSGFQKKIWIAGPSESGLLGGKGLIDEETTGGKGVPDTWNQGAMEIAKDKNGSKCPSQKRIQPILLQVHAPGLNGDAPFQCLPRRLLKGRFRDIAQDHRKTLSGQEKPVLTFPGCEIQDRQARGDASQEIQVAQQ